MRYLSKLNIIVLFSASLFLLQTIQAMETTVGGSTQINEDSSNFKNLGITKHSDLDSFQGTIKGVELECSHDEDGKIGFCSNKSCQQNLKGHKTERDNPVKISAEYAEFIENYGYKCVVLMKEKHGCKKSAAFCGIGGHAKRNARKKGDTGVPSRHSTGDAMDVSGSLMCGGKEIVKFTIDGRAAKTQAYDDFKACWDEQAKIAAEKEPSKYLKGHGGCIGCEGSEGKANSGHNDHIHISAPVKRKEPISNT